MPQITIRNLTIGYRGPSLLEDVSCRIDPGERIGLLGRNGSGKTTLMRLIFGLEKPESGDIELAAGTRIAILPQDVPGTVQGRVADIIASGLPPEFEELENHWERDQFVQRALEQLQLDGDALFETLSTGMKRRVLLGQAIVGKPDVLLLDEPTNHLDVDAIAWLESFLAYLNTTLIFVTHDRAFLTRLANRILEIDRGKLFDWSCDYPTFLKRKEQALHAEERQQSLFDKKLAEEEVWIRTGIKARRTRNEGRVRALEAMRLERSKRRKVDGGMRLQIDSGERSGMLVCDLEQASFGYDHRVIVPPIDVTIMRGDKIGIIGRNGAGKSTLLKGLLGHIQPMAGTVRFGTKLEIAYFDQMRELLDPDKTAEENVGQGKTSVMVNGKSKHIISYLQDFLFTPEQARTSIRYLSGGQRNRLLLAKLFARSANLLVMDEPTNDLEIESVELLEERLVEYTGTVIVVSHDRAFLDNVVTSTIVFEEEGIKEYVGGYEDWMRQRGQRMNSLTSSSLESKASRGGSGSKNGSIQSTLPATAKKLSFKERSELEKLPRIIEQYESDLSQLHAAMAQPEYFKIPQSTLVRDQSRLQELEGMIAKSYERWQSLSERDG